MPHLETCSFGLEVGVEDASSSLLCAAVPRVIDVIEHTPLLAKGAPGLARLPFALSGEGSGMVWRPAD